MSEYPPFDLHAVEQATAVLAAAGHRLLQTHAFADSDAEQVAFLLKHLEPCTGALVLDVGCGMGEVPRLMSKCRPDLRFVLANLSPYQLSLCPRGKPFYPLLSDAHRLGLGDGCIDAVLYASALCQMNHAVAIQEAHRVLKPGGVMLVSDMVRSRDDGGAMERLVAARVLSPEGLLGAIEAAGLTLDDVTLPDASEGAFRKWLDAAGQGALLDGVSAIIIRAIKPQEPVGGNPTHV